MNTRALIGLAFAGVAVLVSCSQDKSPASLVPTEASFVVTKDGCSFSTANGNAKLYFASKDDAVFGHLDAMQKAWNSGGAAAATDPGFTVLEDLARATDAGQVKATATPLLASTFANDVRKCTTSPAFVDFTSAFGPKGLFAVRRVGSTLAVTSRFSDPVTHFPLFGSEPYTTAPTPPLPTWPISTTTVIYGYPLAFADNEKFVNETRAGAAFNISKLPTDAFSSPVRSGVCSVDNANARILHKHVVGGATQVSILPAAGVPNFCVATTPLTTGFKGAILRVADWFTPQPLFAFAAFGGGAGLSGGYSDLGPVSYTADIKITVPPLANTTLTADPQFYVTGNPPVTVKAVTAAGNPFRGTITLVVTGNKGSFNISNNVADTDENGIATFPALRIDKAGGYLMTANSDFGISPAVNFWINGQ